MKIFLGTDHAGFQLKEQVSLWLQGSGFEVMDMGAHEYNEGDDYPDFVLPVASQIATHAQVSADPVAFGIVFGGSGTGEAIAVNRIPGARSAVYYGGPLEIVELSRKHNNANVLSLGARFIDFDTAKNAITLFLETKFEGGRHIQRLEKIN